MIVVMFITLLACLFLGMPVAFSIGASSVVFCLMNGAPKLAIIAQRMVEGVDSFPLMALPLFILSGEIMAYGSTPRLMRLANMLLGRIPGGLAATASLSCGMFGAISGSAVATVAAIGGIVSPEMVKSGYKKSFTASLVAGSGVMGMIIPPSFCMVLYGAASGYVSIEGMFLAGFIPGIFTILLFIVYSVVIGKRRGYVSARRESLTPRQRVFIVLDALPPLMMPAIILGGVLSGVFPPTESAAVAAMYAFVLATFVYRQIDLATLVRICTRSAISSAIVMLIISMAAPFGWILAMQGVPKLIATSVMAMSANMYVVVVLITFVLLFLGMFMEGNSLIILLTPILLPLVSSLGMDAIQFGMVFMMAIAVGGVSPPLAVSLYVSARTVGIRVEQTFPEVLHVLAILVFTTFLCIFWPAFSLYLPSLFGKASF
ncbi:TRAP transporter large permease [Xanthobacteraceae bacterium Astr-EGSB]|uniref:TRAP transporter large permease n=1 Tax=Astrobacterium formosum TaxID=3069710 RepID=UPI0027B09BDC|nr:TRAP transporter large permease [Xanthobacteraceae bacterium Astr-EGSB]